MPNSNDSPPPTSSRRALIGGVLAGGVVLSLQQVLEAAAEPEAKSEPAEPLRIVLSFRELGALSKPGGSQVIDSPAGKLIVARVDESSFVALSAICTHKGCEIEYRAGQKQFACPCHGARFGLDGTVQRGPAKKPLASYEAQASLVIRAKQN